MGQQLSTDTIMGRVVSYTRLPRDWASVEEVLKKFLWTKTTLLRWRESWEAAMGRKERLLRLQRPVVLRSDSPESPRDGDRPQVGYRMPVAPTCSLISLIIRRRALVLQQ